MEVEENKADGKQTNSSSGTMMLRHRLNTITETQPKHPQNSASRKSGRHRPPAENTNTQAPQGEKTTNRGRRLFSNKTSQKRWGTIPISMFSLCNRPTAITPNTRDYLQERERETEQNIQMYSKRYKLFTNYLHHMTLKQWKRWP